MRSRVKGAGARGLHSKFLREVKEEDDASQDVALHAVRLEHHTSITMQRDQQTLNRRASHQCKLSQALHRCAISGLPLNRLPPPGRLSP
eukprot:1184593-Prorocentrum_minimum.AAC.4